jgi:hypothetical protein
VDGLSHFVGKSETELWECLVVENAPNDTIIKRKVAPLELGDTVVALTVCHIQKTEVRQDTDKDGVRLTRDAGIGGMLGEGGKKTPRPKLIITAYDGLLRGIDFRDTLLEGIVDELLTNETVCYHICLFIVQI